jgi:hypothetical protein
LENVARRLVGDQKPTPPPPPDVVVVVGGGGGEVVGGGGGEVVGGAVGGGLVGGGLVGGGLAGAGPDGAGLFPFAGDDVGRVVVEFEFDPGEEVGGTVAVVPALFVRLIVPFDLTVNQLFAKPCPPACDWEWSAAKKKRP